MTQQRERLAKWKRIDVGIDVHKKTWSVCVLCECEELCNAVLPTDAERIMNLLRRYGAREVHTVLKQGQLDSRFMTCSKPRRSTPWLRRPLWFPRSVVG